MTRKSASTKKRAIAKDSGLKERIASRNLHVIPRDNEWVIVSEGSPKARSVHNTQLNAIKAARKVAKVNHGQLVIHARSGRVRAREYYWKEAGLLREPREVMAPDAPPLTASIQEIRSAVSAAVPEGPANEWR